jgi:hypothetical protein
MKRRCWLGVASRENRIQMLHGRSAGVESRLDGLLVKGREYRKGIDWLEFFGFLENLHEHLRGLFDTTGVMHVFGLFIVTRDIHEIVVGE